jgi:NADH dehydrogenase FAD-containing subunit
MCWACVQILEADLVLWAAGSTPVPKVEAGKLSLPFPTAPRGATQTDPTLRVLGHPRVFALGDVAMARSGASVGASAGGDLTTAQQLPATAQVGLRGL